MEYLPTGMNDFVAMYLGSPVPIYIMVAIAAYFLGCFNGAVIVSKYILRNDIRNHGSGNAGLTNFHRVFGGGLTFVVILCDVLKAVLAVLIGSGLFGLCLENAVLGKYWAGLFCLLGHMFPCMFGFKGGKGVLVGAVMLAFFDWRVFVIAFALFILSVVLTKWISLGSILGAVSFPITTWLFYRDPVLTAMAFGMAAAVVFMHRSNIGRILHGTENKFSFKSKKTIEASPDGEEK